MSEGGEGERGAGEPSPRSKPHYLEIHGTLVTTQNGVLNLHTRRQWGCE